MNESALWASFLRKTTIPRAPVSACGFGLRLQLRPDKSSWQAAPVADMRKQRQCILSAEQD